MFIFCEVSIVIVVIADGLGGGNLGFSRLNRKKMISTSIIYDAIRD